MPYVVNEQPVPEELIRQAEQRLARDPRWQTIPDEAERARCLHAAAEYSAVERFLVEQAAARDPRPVDPGAIQQEIKRRKRVGQWRGNDDDHLCLQVERGLRFERTVREMTAKAKKPASEEVRAFYQTHQENFRKPDRFRAAHIVKYVNGVHGKEQARAGIEAAQAALDRGEPFPEVADRYSDYKGRGGDLGQFRAGLMPPEFDSAIRALQPGQRTGIFTTRLGFHIARLDAVFSGGQAGFDDVRGDIERVLTAINEHQAYLEAVAELRSRATIRWEPAT